MATMNEKPASTVTPVAWPLRQVGRLFLSAIAGAVVALAATGLPSETRAIFGLDVFLVSLVTLTSVMMSVTTTDQCVAMANQKQPIRHTEVIASVVATLVGIAAIGVMLHSQRDEARWLKTLHLGGSLLALLFGWIAAQMTFAVQYMRTYYRNLETRSNGRGDPGLDFPGQRTPDLWDFVYSSFTIAMCFQTSDVSISGTAIRRLTLMHAMYSFFFVAAIIGFVVNVLSNLA
jgi:uncharacterized membrane protein